MVVREFFTCSTFPSTLFHVTTLIPEDKVTGAGPDDYFCLGQITLLAKGVCWEIAGPSLSPLEMYFPVRKHCVFYLLLASEDFLKTCLRKFQSRCSRFLPIYYANNFL